MVDQVVSSRFGARPLLDIPAMQVSSRSQQEFPSLQHQVPPLRLEPYNTGLPRPGEAVPRPYHTAPPPESFHPHPREYNDYYGPQGEVVEPLPYYRPPHERYPGVHIPHSSYHPPPHHPHPAPHHPHPAPHHPPPLPQQPPPLPHPHAYHPPPATVPPHMYQNRRPAHYEPRPQTFDVTCELDYGRVAHISVRESHGHFRGVPDYLRRELQKTYGRYPSMEVKIRYENGDYHIYANHDRKPARREKYERRRNRYLEEDEDSYEDRRDHRYDDDEETMTNGIQPREMGAPRGIIREPGWNSYR